MKKQVFILTLLIAMTGISTTKAQTDYTTFRLVLKSTGQCLTNDHGTLAIADKRTGKNQQSQLFVLHRVADNKVWVASALDNSLYIKRSQNDVVLAAHPATSDLEFHWALNYAGGPYRYFAKGDTPSMALKVSGTQTGFANFPSLNGSDDPSGDGFLFYLESVTRTF